MAKKRGDTWTKVGITRHYLWPNNRCYQHLYPCAERTLPSWVYIRRCLLAGYFRHRQDLSDADWLSWEVWRGCDFWFLVEEARVSRRMLGNSYVFRDLWFMVSFLWLLRVHMFNMKGVHSFQSFRSISKCYLVSLLHTLTQVRLLQSRFKNQPTKYKLHLHSNYHVNQNLQ